MSTENIFYTYTFSIAFRNKDFFILCKMHMTLKIHLFFGRIKISMYIYICMYSFVLIAYQFVKKSILLLQPSSNFQSILSRHFN